MGRRSRGNRVARWGGVVLLACIAGLWLASGWVQVGFQFARPRWNAGVVALCGRVHVYTVGAYPPGSAPAVRTGVILRSVLKAQERPGTWRWRAWYDMYHTVLIGGNQSYVLALWAVFLAIGLPTALLWDRHLRIPAGSCRECRYNLEGVTGNVCPECGADRTIG